MTKIKNTNTKNKVTKVPKVKLDYKQMYESEVKLTSSLRDEYQYEQNLRIKRGEEIFTLKDKIASLKIDIRVFSILNFIMGILVAYIIELFI